MARHADTEMTAMKKKVCTQGFLRTEGTGATGGPVQKWGGQEAEGGRGDLGRSLSVVSKKKGWRGQQVSDWAA